ncbi:MAG: carbohydrate kinase [Oscillospiraceae bacterium]|nr:carbohydrate kinase [Oscillospiraceae bacterium]
MKKQFDVLALGELLVDFTQNGESEQGNTLFEANPGGAPANVLAMLRKLGKSCAFVGKVGKDSFGDMLERVVSDTGVDTTGLLRDPEIPTTLAVVHTFPGGDRDFSFYRKPGADINLSAEELNEKLIQSCRIFHFGSLSLTDEPCRTATVRALALAKESGAMISFDPNLRPPLWKSEDAAREQIAWGLAQCDILKIADNEIRFMTGEEDFDRGAAVLQTRYPNITLLNVTAGAEGSYSYYHGISVYEPACRFGGVIETTGAGDTFCACVLNYVLEHGLEAMKEENLREMLRFANSAAYLVTTKKGAICSMPEKADVERILAGDIHEKRRMNCRTAG